MSHLDVCHSTVIVQVRKTHSNWCSVCLELSLANRCGGLTYLRHPWFSLHAVVACNKIVANKRSTATPKRLSSPFLLSLVRKICIFSSRKSAGVCSKLHIIRTQATYYKRSKDRRCSTTVLLSCWCCRVRVRVPPPPNTNLANRSTWRKQDQDNLVVH